MNELELCNCTDGLDYPPVRLFFIDEPDIVRYN